MRAVLFGTQQQYQEWTEATHILPEYIDCTKWIPVPDYDLLQRCLIEQEYDIIIITADGANGMEACIAARKMCPNTPLIWLSNDRDFAAQSYRLGCTYFAARPVAQYKLLHALERCQQVLKK